MPRQNFRNRNKLAKYSLFPLFLTKLLEITLDMIILHANRDTSWSFHKWLIKINLLVRFPSRKGQDVKTQEAGEMKQSRNVLS